MLPTPRSGWVVSIEFTATDERGFIGPAENWEGIDEFVLSHNSAPSVAEVGRRLHVQTNKLENGYYRCQNYNQGRDDQLTPSGTLAVKITERSVDSYSIGVLDGFPFVDTVRIYGKTPATVMRVPIEAVAPMDGFALSDVSGYEWPDSGTTVRVFTNQGESSVRHTDYPYEFQIDEQAPVTGIAEVNVRYEDGGLMGSIERFETDAPSNGEIIEARLNHNKTLNRAWFGENNDWIELNDYPPVSGNCKVEITDSFHPIQGRIVEKPKRIPDVGSVVVAHVRGKEGEAYATPEEFDARINIE